MLMIVFWYAVIVHDMSSGHGIFSDHCCNIGYVILGDYCILMIMVSLVFMVHVVI